MNANLLETKLNTRGIRVLKEMEEFSEHIELYEYDSVKQLELHNFLLTYKHEPNFNYTYKINDCIEWYIYDLDIDTIYKANENDVEKVNKYIIENKIFENPLKQLYFRVDQIINPEHFSSEVVAKGVVVVEGDTEGKKGESKAKKYNKLNDIDNLNKDILEDIINKYKDYKEFFKFFNIKLPNKSEFKDKLKYLKEAKTNKEGLESKQEIEEMCLFNEEYFPFGTFSAQIKNIKYEEESEIFDYMISASSSVITDKFELYISYYGDDEGSGDTKYSITNLETGEGGEFTDRNIKSKKKEFIESIQSIMIEYGYEEETHNLKKVQNFNKLLLRLVHGGRDDNGDETESFIGYYTLISEYCFGIDLE